MDSTLSWEHEGEQNTYFTLFSYLCMFALVGWLRTLQRAGSDAPGFGELLFKSFDNTDNDNV